MQRLVLALLLLIPTTSAAAEQAHTWENLLQLTQKKSPDFLLSTYDLKAKSAEKKAILSEFLPKINLSAERSSSTTKVSGTESTSKSTDYGITARLNLFQGFSSLANYRRLSRAEEEAEVNLRLKSAQVRYELRIAYFSLLINLENLRLNEKILERESNNQKFISLKYESGSEARWNLLKASADVESVRQQLLKAKVDIANSMNDLERITGEKITALIPQEQLYEFTIPKEIHFASLLKAKKQYLLLEQANQNIRISQAAYYPSVSASISNSVRKTEAAPKSTSQSASITAEWNIFNGLSDHYTLQKANASASAQELALETLLRTLKNDFETKKSAFELAKTSQPQAELAKKAAQERARTVTTQYRNGLKSYLDWEQAQSSLIEMEKAELRAREQILLAKADLENFLSYSLEIE